MHSDKLLFVFQDPILAYNGELVQNMDTYFMWLHKLFYSPYNTFSERIPLDKSETASRTLSEEQTYQELSFKAVLSGVERGLPMHYSVRPSSACLWKQMLIWILMFSKFYFSDYISSHLHRLVPARRFDSRSVHDVKCLNFCLMAQSFLLNHPTKHSRDQLEIDKKFEVFQDLQSPYIYDWYQFFHFAMHASQKILFFYKVSKILGCMRLQFHGTKIFYP